VKTPKRVKGYVRTILRDTPVGELKSSRRHVMLYGDDRVARVVELRKGEVIVDVEALVEEFTSRSAYGLAEEHPLRAALRKVGKR
jgi:hypothetical protein